MNNRASFAVCVAVALCGLHHAAHATPPGAPSPRVGVVVVSAVGLDEDVAWQIADQLRDALVAVLDVEIPRAAETRSRLSSPAGRRCIRSVGCVRRVGTELGVSELLFLAVVRVGPNTTINVSWSEASTGTTELRDPIRLPEGDPGDALAATAGALLPGASRRPEPGAAPPEGVDPAADGAAPIAGGASIGVRSPDSDAGAGGGPSTAGPLNGQDGRPRGRRVTTGVVAFGVIAGLSLAGGAALGVTALRDDGDVCRDAGNCGDIDSRALYADMFYGVAAVATLTAGYLYLRSGRGESSSSVPAVPAVPAVTVAPTGPAGPGVTFLGRF